MADSEEDGDSDYFESADENLSDENETENKFEKNSDVSVVDHDSNSTVGYRKRPERIRASPVRSRSSESPLKKINVLEDFVKSDELLHDLTSNISKNINRSLGSIQQTSSSIKDMVFKSLPNTTSNLESEKLDLFENDSDDFPLEEEAPNLFSEEHESSINNLTEKLANVEVSSDIRSDVDEENSNPITIREVLTEKEEFQRDVKKAESETMVSKEEIVVTENAENENRATTEAVVMVEKTENEKKVTEEEVVAEDETELQMDVRKAESENFVAENIDEANVNETERNPEVKEGITFSKSEGWDDFEKEEDWGDFEKTEGWDDFDFDESELNVSSPRKSETESKYEKREIRKESEAEKGSWGLPTWGVGSLLDTATAVTRGISTVLESGLGVPDPETLARAQKLEESQSPKKENVEIQEEREDRSSFPSFGITSLVAGVTSKIVEHSKVQEIGSKVISGGLDTLENIGKKTMQVLQEGDPGLKKKRALLLGNEKPVLSQILREAKERQEKEDRKLQEKQAQRNCRFETLFDDFQGLVHLEALEMLSTQCELKLDQLRISTSDQERLDLEGILQEVKELCDIEESDFEVDPSTAIRFKTVLTEAVEPLKNEISIKRIIEIHEESEEWLKKKDFETQNSKIIYQKAMSTMAELTAATAHQFHKAGELLMVKERRKTVEEAEALMELTKLLCLEISFLSGKFLEILKKAEDSDGSDAQTGNIIRESENAISYIKQAFNLLVPVIQLGAT